jgi:hypothetical protein
MVLLVFGFFFFFFFFFKPNVTNVSKTCRQLTFATKCQWATIRHWVVGYILMAHWNPDASMRTVRHFHSPPRRMVAIVFVLISFFVSVSYISRTCSRLNVLPKPNGAFFHVYSTRTKKKKKKKKIVLTFVCFSVVARPTNNGSYYRACDNVEGTENCTVVLGRFVDCFGASRRARKLQIAFLKLVRRLSKWCPTRHALCAQQLSSSFAGRCRRQRS